jgi:hypothetical protein
LEISANPRQQVTLYHPLEVGAAAPIISRFIYALLLALTCNQAEQFTSDLQPREIILPCCQACCAVQTSLFE